MKQVNITFGFGAVVCFLAWLDTMACLRFLAAMLFHEGGHLLAMCLTGAPIYGVSLKASGAVIEGDFSDLRQQFVCAAAGPFFSFLLGYLTMRALPELAMVSCLLGVVNLLPVYPLDGGRILRSALLHRKSEQKAERILRLVTAGVCCLLMMGACWAAVELQAGLWPIFAALVILWRVGQVGWQMQE